MPLRTFQLNDPPTKIARAFDEDGFVHLRGAINPDELRALRQDTLAVIQSPRAERLPDSDFFHDPDPQTGAEVFHRVQYVLPKAPGRSMVWLLGHPGILRVVRTLVGDDLFCVAEALVFKMPGNGREVPIHADCNPADPLLAPVIFNVDYYLDDSTVENSCLLVAPGSHRLNLPIEKIGPLGFSFPGLTPVEARAGDVIIHNIRLVHGSHRSSGKNLRRTLYYEFHSLAAILKQGGPRPGYPATERWIADRLGLLAHAIDDRRQHAPYAMGETSFDFRPPAGYDAATPDRATVNLRPALGYNKYF